MVSVFDLLRRQGYSPLVDVPSLSTRLTQGTSVMHAFHVRGSQPELNLRM